MKRLLLYACMTLSLAAQAAPAQDHIVLPATPYKMFPQDWDAYAGNYELSNGATMTLRRRGLRMYAELAGRPPAPLVAVAENVFVSVDRRLRITLADPGLGDVTGEMVMQSAGRR